MRLPTHRPPTTPGEILLEDWLKPMKLTQLALAKKMGVDVQLVNGINNERRSVLHAPEASPPAQSAQAYEGSR